MLVICMVHLTCLVSPANNTVLVSTTVDRIQRDRCTKSKIMSFTVGLQAFQLESLLQSREVVFLNLILSKKSALHLFLDFSSKLPSGSAMLLYPYEDFLS